MSPNALVAQVRALLETLSYVERLKLLEQMFEGICIYCGETVGNRICYCRRDE